MGLGLGLGLATVGARHEGGERVAKVGGGEARQRMRLEAAGDLGDVGEM